MIYLRLSGGLGNQLFQLAAMSLLSRRFCSPVTIFSDGLMNYKSPRLPDSLELLNDSSWFSVAKSGQRSIHRWFSVNSRAGRLLPFLGVNDNTFWSKIYSKNCLKPLYADGYFQEGWSRELISYAINELDVLPVSLYSANRLINNEIAIHIRGGDFLKIPSFQVVNASFYINAVKQCLSLGFTHFAVLTDDYRYAVSICKDIKDKCIDAHIRILDRGITSLDDFDTLRSASGRIIGNSTFAWWAAALGSPDAPTWSPSMFTLGKRRDFFLPNERQVIDGLE
jgi:hypothetical protein